MLGSRFGVWLAVLMACSAFAVHSAQAQDLGYEPTLAITSYTFPGGARQEINVTIWYDTGHFSGQWTWAVPEGFTVTGVTDDHGPVSFTRDPSDPERVSFQTHYPGRSGYRSVSVFGHKTTAEQIAPGIYIARAWAGASSSEGSKAALVLEAPTDGTILMTNGTQWRRWVEHTTETVSHSYAFVHAEALEVYTLDETKHYGLFAPANIGQNARTRLFDVADAAEAVFPDLAKLFGMPSPSERILVILAPDSLFDWEAGWYRDGVVALRASAFTNPEDEWFIEQSRALVHETAHAFMDPVLSWAGGYGDWFNEGSARNAERLVEARYRDHLTVCKPGYLCQNVSSQLEYEDLAAHYARPSAAYSSAWSPRDPQTAGARAFGYEFSGFLVSAFIQQHGEAVYHSALARMVQRDVGGVDFECESCVLRAVEADLVAAANLGDASALYRPYFSEFQSDRARFDSLVAPLVVMERNFEPPSSTSLPSPAFPVRGIPGAGGVISSDESSGPSADATAPGAITIPSLPGGETTLYPLVAIGAAVVPAYLYSRVVRRQGTLAKPSGMKRYRLRGFGYVYNGQGSLFNKTEISVADGPGTVLISTRLHSTLAPRGLYSVFFVLFLLGGPLYAYSTIARLAPLAGPLWLGVCIAWAGVVAYEVSRNPRIVWLFDGLDAAFRESGRFNKAKLAWRIPVANIDAIVLRPGSLTREGRPISSHEIAIVSRQGQDVAVATLEDRNDAMAVATLISQSCRCRFDIEEAQGTLRY